MASPLRTESPLASRSAACALSPPHDPAGGTTRSRPDRTGPPRFAVDDGPAPAAGLLPPRNRSCARPRTLERDRRTVRVFPTRATGDRLRRVAESQAFQAERPTARQVWEPSPRPAELSEQAPRDGTARRARCQQSAARPQQRHPQTATVDSRCVCVSRRWPRRGRVRGSRACSSDLSSPTDGSFNASPSA